MGDDADQSRPCASRLGERKSGTARLEEAVAAYRAALEEWTRERVPLDWAQTQNNLGNALGTLGEREGGTARLEEAVAAYRAALEERTRERVPLDWAMSQNNLGNALRALGDRESGTARLEEAVAAYRAALEERTRDRVPLRWATTQNNLGVALRMLGERESGTARLEQAIAAWNGCLEVTRTVWPPQWVQWVEARRDETLAEIACRSATRRRRRRLRKTSDAGSVDAVNSPSKTGVLRTPFGPRPPRSERAFFQNARLPTGYGARLRIGRVDPKPIRPQDQARLSAAALGAARRKSPAVLLN